MWYNTGMKKILLLPLICVLGGCSIDFIRTCRNTKTGALEGRSKFTDGRCEAWADGPWERVPPGEVPAKMKHKTVYYFDP